MNNNVAGIHVPDEMLEELKADKEKTKAGITGVEIAARIIKECKPYCQGVHIMALGWESKIPDLDPDLCIRNRFCRDAKPRCLVRAFRQIQKL